MVNSDLYHCSPITPDLLPEILHLMPVGADPPETQRSIMPLVGRCLMNTEILRGDY